MALKDTSSICTKRSRLFACLVSSLFVSSICAETSKPVLTALESTAHKSKTLQAGTSRIPEFEDVYRIEIIIFSNRNNLDTFEDNNDSDVTEYWHDTPALSYPNKLVFLHPPAKLLPQVPATNNNHTNNFDTEADKAAINITAPTFDDIPLSDETNINLTDTRTAVEKALAELPLLEQLEPDTFLLKDMAAAIARRSNHQVLFHQAWHQELGAKETAPSIPISGGETFDNHHELEGSIKINKDRYLHITSDLWLTKYSLRNDEQWNRLTNELTENSLQTAKIIDTSSVPDFPLDLIRIGKDKEIEKAIKEAELAKAIEDEALYQYTLEQDEQAALALNAPTATNQELTAEANSSLTDNGKNVNGNVYDNIDTNLIETETTSEEETSLSFDLFQAQETYVLREHRKMKRAEIHFLDHPMLGLIIQITKYEVPEEAKADENLN